MIEFNVGLIVSLAVGLVAAVIGGVFLRDVVKSDKRSEKDNKIFEYSTYAGLGFLYIVWIWLSLSIF